MNDAIVKKKFLAFLLIFALVFSNGAVGFPLSANAEGNADTELKLLPYETGQGDTELDKLIFTPGLQVYMVNPDPAGIVTATPSPVPPEQLGLDPKRFGTNKYGVYYNVILEEIDPGRENIFEILTVSSKLYTTLKLPMIKTNVVIYDSQWRAVGDISYARVKAAGDWGLSLDRTFPRVPGTCKKQQVVMQVTCPPWTLNKGETYYLVIYGNLNKTSPVAAPYLQNDIVFRFTTKRDKSYCGVTFNGNGAGDTAGENQAEIGADYRFTLTKEAGYDYTVNMTMSGEKITEFTESESEKTVSYIISNVTGELVVTVEKTKQHVHLFSSEWKKEQVGHWHECECGEKADIANHSFGEWITDDGARHRNCIVCGYTENEILAVTPDTDNPVNSNNNTGTDNKFDSRQSDQYMWMDRDTQQTDYTKTNSNISAGNDANINVPVPVPFYFPVSGGISVMDSAAKTVIPTSADGFSPVVVRSFVSDAAVESDDSEKETEKEPEKETEKETELTDTSDSQVLLPESKEVSDGGIPDEDVLLASSVSDVSSNRSILDTLLSMAVGPGLALAGSGTWLIRKKKEIL